MLKRRFKDFCFKVISKPLGSGIDGQTRMLAYHSVGDGENDISIPTDQFKEQIEWLLDHDFRILTLRQWWQMAGQDCRAPERSVVLTFDDGFRGVWLNAAPVLRAHGLVGTIFVVTDTVGKVNRFDKPLGSPELSMISWHELGELVNMGWDIQSHGQHHYPMVGLKPDTLEDELKGSKAVLEKNLGVSVDFFCYPYGAFDQNTVRAVSLAGYSAAVTCWAGTLGKSALRDPYRLHRVMLDGINQKNDFIFRFTYSYRRISRIWFWSRRLIQKHNECLLDEMDEAMLQMVPQS